MYLSELYDIEEHQVMVGYGAEDLLKKTVHYFLTKGNNRKMLIPKFSWWYYKSIADEVEGETELYPMYEQEDTYTYNLDELKAIVEEKQPRCYWLHLQTTQQVTV